MRRKEKVDKKPEQEPIDASLTSTDVNAVSEDEVVTCDCTTDAAKLNADIEQIRNELDKLKQDADEAQSRYLRTLADFDNFRKRQREDVARQMAYAKENLLIQFLSVYDNLERAINAAESQQDFDSLYQGVGLTFRMMQDMLTKEGVAPIEAEGQEFNPELHEAMMRDTSGEYPENTVIQEFEKGYTIDGKVLRPSRVKVSAEE